LRKHPIGVLEPFPLGPVNPKHEIPKCLMWDMRYEICVDTPLSSDGFYLTSQISHPHLKKGIAIAA
jgi:hypothetical protein